MSPIFHVPVEAFVENHPKFEMPVDPKGLDVAIIGAPNVGKSAIMNLMVDRDISAVSSKAHTTGEKIEGSFTDLEKRTQLIFIDTPGAGRSLNKMTSSKLVSREWGCLEESDLAMFVVDSVRRLDFDTKESLKRLNKLIDDPSLRRFNDAMKSGTYSEDALERGDYNLDQDELKYTAVHYPQILVMNKVDLVYSKKKLRYLQSELEDMGRFDHVFHTSAETGFGLDALKEYLIDRAKPKLWRYHPSIQSNYSEV
jgi:GTP-binding protein Era